jgi:hypothetical protein
MSLVQQITDLSLLDNYTNITKLIVFRYISVNGNACNGDYNNSNNLTSVDLEKISMDISKVEIQDATTDTPKSYLLYDAHSNCIYTISFYSIPATYNMNIYNINNNNALVIYQTYLTA